MIMHWLNLKKGIIGIEANKPDAIVNMHRLIEQNEIKDIEIRATIGTKLFHYAHLIIYPYNGKKIMLRNIRNAEELALIILKLQEKLQRTQPDQKN